MHSVISPPVQIDAQTFPTGIPSRAETNFDHLESVILPRVWSDHVNRLMACQKLQHGDSEGGFDWDGTEWCDGRHAAYSLSILIASVGRPWDLPSEVELSDAILRTSRFLIRRQHPDGRLDLAGAYSPNEVGFAIPGLAAGYRYLSKRNQEGLWDEILGNLELFLKRGAEAVLAGSAFTANHRWAAACAPLAAVNQIWPDPRYLEKIESYLADGVDCDTDGCWFEERSPNYNTVANHGMYVMADCLQRPEFSRVVERNGRFMLQMIQPNGEADSSFSHRQDRAWPDRPILDYAILRRLAQTTGEGAYVTLLLEHLQKRSKEIPTSGLVPLLYWMDEFVSPLPEAAPIPAYYHKSFLDGQVLRIRRNERALTLAADSGNHFFTNVRDQWGGGKRSDEWFHLHGDGVVIASIQLAAAGMAMFQPESMETFPSGAKLHSNCDGWDHTLHFRPESPSLRMVWDWETTVDLNWSNDLDQVRLHLRSQTEHSLAALLKIWVRPGVTLREDGGAKAVSLKARETIWLRGGKSLVLKPGTATDGRGLRISGLPSSIHNHNHGCAASIPSAVASTCSGLFLGLRFPLDFRLIIEGV